ncbi:hypothetical protein [Halosimplex sp. J119]
MSAAVSDGSASLVSRTLITWLELTVVGITGGAVGAAVGGPPAFVAYLLTTLLSVGVLFYNVAALVDARTGSDERDESPSPKTG